ncbi:MAG: Txe/YoeB family addiction module toxin [Thermostichus sp. HHBFW_bins_43]
MLFDDAPPPGGGFPFFGDVNVDQPAPNTENPHPKPEKSHHPPRFDYDYTPQFEEDLTYWVKKQKQVAKRIRDLVNSVLQDPFSGLGKPEHLKYVEPGTWSRRINEEHRLVYWVDDHKVVFLAARYHYGKHRK